MRFQIDDMKKKLCVSVGNQQQSLKSPVKFANLLSVFAKIDTCKKNSPVFAVVSANRRK